MMPVTSTAAARSSRCNAVRSHGPVHDAPCYARGVTEAPRTRSIPWAALASGFTAALALAVSTYNVYLQRQQIRAQVWPRLEWSYSNVGGFSFQLHNSGVGPAVLKSVRIDVDGKPVATWPDALARLGSIRSDYRMGQLSSRVLSPGASIEALRIADEEAGRAFEPEARRIGATLCYCSTLDDCWQHDSSGRTVEVDDCPAVTDAFQQ
jgi:hypothetical protein